MGTEMTLDDLKNLLPTLTKRTVFLWFKLQNIFAICMAYLLEEMRFEFIVVPLVAHSYLVK